MLETKYRKDVEEKNDGLTWKIRRLFCGVRVMATRAWIMRGHEPEKRSSGQYSLRTPILPCFLCKIDEKKTAKIRHPLRHPSYITLVAAPLNPWQNYIDIKTNTTIQWFELEMEIGVVR